MLKLRLKFLLETKGVSNPYNFLIKHGFSPNIATRYLNSKVDMVNLAYLEKLCLILQCSPNELFEWEPAKDITLNESHPMAMLIRNDKPFNIISHINNLPLDKVKQLQQYIAELDKKKED